MNETEGRAFHTGKGLLYPQRGIGDHRNCSSTNETADGCRHGPKDEPRKTDVPPAESLRVLRESMGGGG